MKKVLMFIDYYNNGNIERVINMIYDNLKSDYHIDLLSFCNLKSEDKVKSILNENYSSFIKRNIQGLFKLKEYFKNNNYDIMHIHCYNSFGLVYAFFARKYVKKIIIHAHDSGIDNDCFRIKKLINSIIKLFFKSSKYIYTAPSYPCIKFCFGKCNYRIIPNWIDYEKYKFNMDERLKYRNEFGFKDKEVVVGHIGKFERQKNHSFLIDVFFELRKRRKNYKLVLIGDGSLLEQIKEKVSKLELDQYVIFLPPRDDINKLINMFDIYLFPSLYEGFPLTVLENQVNSKYVFTSKNIDKNIKISNRFKQYYLEDGPKHWAIKIINNNRCKFFIKVHLELNDFVRNIMALYE